MEELEYWKKRCGLAEAYIEKSPFDPYITMEKKFSEKKPPKNKLHDDSCDLMNKYWEIKNNAGEQFKFFINEKNMACLNVYLEKDLIASLIMSKKEFENLIYGLTEMIKNVDR